MRPGWKPSSVGDTVPTLSAAPPPGSARAYGRASWPRSLPGTFASRPAETVAVSPAVVGEAAAQVHGGHLAGDIHHLHGGQRREGAGDAGAGVDHREATH